MSKMYIFFNKNGIAVNVVSEEIFEGMVKAKITERYDWQCYTPEQKYYIPWLQNTIKDKGSLSLEEMQLEYIEYVYIKHNRKASTTAIALDMDRKTLYRYLKLIENKNFLEKDKLE